MPVITPKTPDKTAKSHDRKAAFGSDLLLPSRLIAHAQTSGWYRQ